MLIDTPELRPAFNGHASGALSCRRGKESDSAADRAQGDRFGFERRDSSLEQALHRIEGLLRTGLTGDMMQAHEMMRHVWQSLPFGHEAEAPLLRKLEDTAALIAKRKMTVLPLFPVPPGFLPTKIFS